MNKKSKIIKYLMYAMGIFVIFYISYQFVNIIMPDNQFVFDTSESEIGNISLYAYHKGGIKFDLQKMDDKTYFVNVDKKIYGKEYKIYVDTDANHSIKSVMLNDNLVDKKSNNFYKISDLTSFSYYTNLVVIRERNLGMKKLVLIVLIFLIFSCIFSFTYYYTKKRNHKFWEKFIYSSSSLKLIGYKPILLSVLITLLSIIIYHGCDLNSIADSIVMQQKGVDVYQLIASVDTIKGVGMKLWSYDFVMLIFYDLSMTINRLFLPLFNPNSYHIVQVVLFKIVNILLMNLTILAILSFLYDEGYIKEKSKIRTIYFWSIFNPLTFYISILFIQLDAFPAYCLTIGILLLSKLKNNYCLSALFLTWGIASKTQLFLVIPVILLLIFFEAVKNKRLFWQYYFFLIINVSFCLVIPRLANTTIKYALSNIPQAERAWFTVIQYAPQVYLYITIFFLVLFMLFNVFHINLEIEINNFILSTLYYIAIICLLLSFSILSTPSTMIQTLAAFVLIFTFSKDNLQRFFIALFALLIVFSEMFGSVGDITASLRFFGKTSLFVQFEAALGTSPQGVKWISVLFTIAHSAMLAYAIYFYQKSQEVLKFRR
ncbi:MAG: hypothetical protein ACERKN_03675 [Velocimicrobium sp.]